MYNLYLAVFYQCRVLVDKVVYIVRKDRKYAFMTQYIYLKMNLVGIHAKDMNVADE